MLMDESTTTRARAGRVSQTMSNPEKYSVTVYVNKDISAEFVVKTIHRKLNTRKRK